MTLHRGTRHVVRPALCIALAAGTAASLAALNAPRAGASVAWTSTGTGAMTLVHATSLGAESDVHPVTVRVAMALRHEPALKSFISSVNTPGSVDYGHFLTPAAFLASFGPTASAVQAVETYLKANGFSGVSVSSNRLLVSATGTVGAAETAFDTSIGSFRQASATVYANTTPAMVPASLDGSVASVLGLTDIVAMHTPIRHVSAAGTAAGTGVPQYAVSYTPNQFPSIYGATASTPTGSATAIAIVAEGKLTQVVTDLRAEEAANNLPQVPVTTIPSTVNSSDVSGLDEWDMDTQSSTGMANTVSQLYMYDATTLTDSDLAVAINNFASGDVAKAGSASLGECEAFPYLDGSMAADDQAFAEAAAQGQSFFASSGDTGASCAVAGTNGVPGSGPPEVNYPASAPFVTAVGGTTLLTNSDNSYNQEIAWNAGGGGTSILEPAPAWQSGVVPASALGKGVPDIAMDGDPYSGVTIFVNGASSPGWGGTSLSSPLALGVWARLESGNSNALGAASAALYGAYRAGSCTSAGVTDVCTSPAFHDITVGTNGTFLATPGWDYTTGIGSLDIGQAETRIK